jgi:hypothetical protein
MSTMGDLVAIVGVSNVSDFTSKLNRDRRRDQNTSIQG